VSSSDLNTILQLNTLNFTGHLQLEDVSAVVVDWNWRDMKKRRLVDVPEIRAELASLLKSYLIPNMKLHLKCKIGML